MKFSTFTVCVLPNQFIPSSKRTCILSWYTLLPSFIKISHELFEINCINTHRLTHRHNDADENDTCQKTKFLGQVKKWKNGSSEVTFIQTGLLILHLMTLYYLIFLSQWDFCMKMWVRRWKIVVSWNTERWFLVNVWWWDLTQFV